LREAVGGPPRRAYTTGGLSPLQRPSERLGPMPRSSTR
jgi:hypothetical protein